MRTNLVFRSIFPILAAAALVLCATGPAQAVGDGPVVRWEDFDDPAFDPSRPNARSTRTATAKPSRASSIPLGPMGVDAKGVQGRVHTVSSGETLWDISEAYLGTPWVWPSVWNENQEIDNPHLIDPGDRIWITSTEMRRVTDDEAQQLLTTVAAPAELVDGDAFQPIEEPLELVAPALEESDLAVAIPLPAGGSTGVVLQMRVDASVGVVSDEVIEAASSILDSPAPRAFLVQGDEVYLGLGEGEVSMGDQFSVYRESVRIRDPATRRTLGHHLPILGWLEVTKVEGESATAVIRRSTSEIQRGDRIVPREILPIEVALREAEPGLDGMIAFTPGIRWMIGLTDAVYLNLGSIHGVEVGTELEVIERGIVRRDRVRHTTVKAPDTVVARIVVVVVKPETSLGYVTQTRRELGVGDLVRGSLYDRLAVR